jgi:hypothetical protein
VKFHVSLSSPKERSSPKLSARANRRTHDAATTSPSNLLKVGMKVGNTNSNLPLHQVVEFLVVSFQVSYLFERIPDNAFHVDKQASATAYRQEET